MGLFRKRKVKTEEEKGKAVAKKTKKELKKEEERKGKKEEKGAVRWTFVILAVSVGLGLAFMVYGNVSQGLGLLNGFSLGSGESETSGPKVVEEDEGTIIFEK